VEKQLQRQKQIPPLRCGMTTKKTGNNSNNRPTIRKKNDNQKDKR
jgi:hypothetical protein